MSASDVGRATEEERLTDVFDILIYYLPGTKVCRPYLHDRPLWLCFLVRWCVVRYARNISKSSIFSVFFASAILLQFVPGPSAL